VHQDRRDVLSICVVDADDSLLVRRDV